MPQIGTLASNVDIRYALADLDTTDGLDMDQGDAEVTISVFGQTFTAPYHWPVQYPQPAPDAWAEAVDGTTEVTFLLNPPLSVSSLPTDDVAYRITYFVHDSFRWEDGEGEG